jgi:cation/acetate symporter
LRHLFGLDPLGGLWLGIQPLSAGVFGVPVGFAAMALATWWMSPPQAVALPQPQAVDPALGRYPGL